MCYIASGMCIWLMPRGAFKFVDEYIIPFAERMYFVYTVLVLLVFAT